MDFLIFIALIIWVIMKLFSPSSSSNGGLSDTEKYQAFDSFRKK